MRDYSNYDIVDYYNLTDEELLNNICNIKINEIMSLTCNSKNIIDNIKAICMYIINNCEYSYDIFNLILDDINVNNEYIIYKDRKIDIGDGNYNSLLYPLLIGKGVCGNFQTLFNHLMALMNVKSYGIDGQCYSDKSKKLLSHGWNQVIIDDVIYTVDISTAIHVIEENNNGYKKQDPFDFIMVSDKDYHENIIKRQYKLGVSEPQKSEVEYIIIPILNSPVNANEQCAANTEYLFEPFELSDRSKNTIYADKNGNSKICPISRDNLISYIGNKEFIDNLFPDIPAHNFN